MSESTREGRRSSVIFTKTVGDARGVRVVHDRQKLAKSRGDVVTRRRNERLPDGPKAPATARDGRTVVKNRLLVGLTCKQNVSARLVADEHRGTFFRAGGVGGGEEAAAR